MAAIDKYKLEIQVVGEAAVKGLAKSLDSLESRLATIGFGAFIANAFKMADAINDVADAVGLTAGYVKGLGVSIQQAGGDMNDVGTILNRFNQNIDDLANGSDKAVDAFRKIGIAQEDLLKLSRQEVLAKAIQSLAEMDAGARRTAVGIDLFGKAFGRIDPKKLDEILRTQDFEKLDAEVRAAADAYQAMEDNIVTLQQAVLAVFQPFIGEMKDLRLSAEQAERIIKILGTTLAVAFGAKLIASLIALNRELKIMLGTSTLLGKTPLVAILGVLAAGALYFANSADEASESTDKFKDSLSSLDGVSMTTIKSYSDQIKELQKQLKAGAISQEEFNKKAEEVARGVKPESMAAATDIEKTNRQKAAEAAQRTTEQLRKQLEIQNAYRTFLIGLIGLESERADALKDDADVIKKLQEDVIDIEAKIQEERGKGKEVNQAVITQLIEQLKLKQQQAAANLVLNSRERERLNTQKEFLASLEKEVSMAVFNEEEKAKFAKATLDLQAQNGEITEQQAEIGKKLAEAEYNYTRRQFELGEKLLALGEDASKQERDRIQQAINQNEIRYRNELNLIAETAKVETQRFENTKLAIEEALASISKQFTPYQMAQDAILAGWNRIGSAIDTFVETGKFKFKDFALSVIADLTKIILKAQILAGIKAVAGAFGFSIPGFAEGGPVQKGKPIIVGEKGPELFVPPNAGQIIPNNQMAKGVATGAVNAPINNTYITNNISAIDAKSVAQLFAENRKTLLGSVRMAEKELPYMGRA